MAPWRSGSGLAVLAGLVSAEIGAIGAVLAFLTSCVTLSFLITTPEAWVPPLGDGEHGFPYLSGAGRLVLKDLMLWAGGFLLMADSARALSAASMRTGFGPASSAPPCATMRLGLRRSQGRALD